MDLKERIRTRVGDKPERFDIDTFGAVMDECINASAVGLLVKKDADGEWEIHGAGCGAVLDFYIFLNALGPIFENMVEEMGGIKHLDAKHVAEALAEEMKKEMIHTAREMEEHQTKEE